MSLQYLQTFGQLDAIEFNVHVAENLLVDKLSFVWLFENCLIVVGQRFEYAVALLWPCVAGLLRFSLYSEPSPCHEEKSVGCSYLEPLFLTVVHI